MKNIVLALIRLYQKSANIRKSLLTALMPNTAADKKTCRFTPTCSQYAYAAIARYGIVKGILLGLKRIVRCHPWSQGGFDPVPN